MSRSTAYIHVSVLHCSRSLFQTRLSAIAPALLYLLYPYSRTDSILAIVLPAIHGSIRQHDKIKAFLCVLCVSVVKHFFTMVVSI